LIARLSSRSAAADTTKERLTARHTLLVGQCAGAVALVVLSVMFVRSFVNLTSFDLGWNPSEVLSMNVSPATRFTTGYGVIEWSQRLVEALEARPGIERAAVTSQIPLSSLSYSDNFAKGRPVAGSEERRWSGVIHSVTDEYFQVMGIRLVEGRAFSPADRFAEDQFKQGAKTEQGVVMVSQTVARTLWPRQSALGQALWIPNVDDVTWRQVVGVVEDIQFHAVGEAPGLHIFVPWTQKPTFVPKLLVKSTSDQAVTLLLVRDVLRTIDPGTRTDNIATLQTRVSDATAQPRFTMRVVVGFALLALTLAAIGIYGTVSYLVSSRARDIAIRLTLGASRREILRAVLRRALVAVGAGAGAGIILAAMLARTFDALLFEVGPIDAGSLVVGGLLMVLTAVLAAFVPSRRALNVDPAASLRSE
jgi:putative ABC transport system permease protein